LLEHEHEGRDDCHNRSRLERCLERSRSRGYRGAVRVRWHLPPGCGRASFEGPEAIADALFGFLGAHKSGQFETAHEVFAGDEAFHEWTWAGVTNEGEPAESHGCDYYLVRDGKVAVRSTFRKV
jgi:hypothetical protein